MNADSHDAASPCIEAAPVTNSFTARAIEDILTERGWFAQDSSEPAVERSAKAFSTWMTAAAALLGPHAPDRTGLADLLSLVFCYDAESLLATAGAQDVMARAGAREVIREHCVVVSGANYPTTKAKPPEAGGLHTRRTGEVQIVWQR